MAATSYFIATFIWWRESILLRPIESKEAMTVNFYQMNLDILKEITDSILELPGVDAVLYDITNKPPATIEWE